MKPAYYQGMLALLLAVTTSIAVENQRPGTPDWEITRPALHQEIEGYASLTSVNGGDAIELLVSTHAPRYAIDVFRMGWYAGAGARRVAGPIVRTGIAQDVPPPDPSTGMVACDWRDPYQLETRDDSGPWPSGIYLARLTTMAARPERHANDEGLQSFIVFVVRDDARASALLFQSSVTTFAAYNNWGGKSLYGFNSGNAPARKVSFDRPYATNPYGVRLDGAGDFLRRWEYNAVRFLEREGYDVTYDTDVDTHERPLVDADAPLRHRVYLSIGHDEYWSSPMRRHVEQARDQGMHLAFLGADVCYWQVRFEPNARGVANRTLVAYKEAAGSLDPLALDGQPQNNRLITGRWRDRPVSRPEARLVGVMYAADPVDADIIVDRPDHWVFEGTGLKKGDALPGLLGYEVDAMSDTGPTSIVRLAHSPFTDQGSPQKVRYADMTVYSAESDALVFATGSIQWSWGLDGYNAPEWHSARVSEAAQRITRNVLDRMLRTETVPHRKETDWGPSPIVLLASVVAMAFVIRAWFWRRMKNR
jgi:N,N-dimethylformamidase beta subunit-like, C-terminal